MIKAYYGKKGCGKTKAIVNSANDFFKESEGDIIFINDTEQLMYDFPHQIRYINISSFPVTNSIELLSFISGLIAGNYDIARIYIDRITYMTRTQPQDLEIFFSKLGALSKDNDVDFVISVSSEIGEVPEYIKPYLG